MTSSRNVCGLCACQIELRSGTLVAVALLVALLGSVGVVLWTSARDGDADAAASVLASASAGPGAAPLGSAPDVSLARRPRREAPPEIPEPGAEDRARVR